MSALSYQWGAGAPQPDPQPVGEGDLTLLVGDQIVWTGDVSAELRRHARWCALQVAHLWDCPEVVREWLETGEESLREGARDVARAAAISAACAAAGYAAISAAWSAARSAAGDAAWYAARYAAGDEAEAAARTAAQPAHLRALLLRRALPERLHPLIDSEESGAEAVVCDALLQMTPHAQEAPCVAS